MKPFLVWFDIPVKNIHRAVAFYENILQVKLNSDAPQYPVAMFDQSSGLFGCLFESDKEQPSATGAIMYFSVEGRLGEAEGLVEKFGGKVLESKRNIAPHGYISTVLDSEGNRIGLHSEKDD